MIWANAGYYRITKINTWWSSAPFSFFFLSLSLLVISSFVSLLCPFHELQWGSWFSVPHLEAGSTCKLTIAVSQSHVYNGDIRACIEKTAVVFMLELGSSWDGNGGIFSFFEASVASFIKMDFDNFRPVEELRVCGLFMCQVSGWLLTHQAGLGQFPWTNKPLFPLCVTDCWKHGF